MGHKVFSDPTFLYASLREDLNRAGSEKVKYSLIFGRNLRLLAASVIFLTVALSEEKDFLKPVSSWLSDCLVFFLES